MNLKMKELLIVIVYIISKILFNPIKQFVDNKQFKKIILY